jgi:TetR/AcrR family fatty acid metabolism transcriptional regulator
MAPNDKPDKRRRILDAAVEVFAQNGFYNSKVSQIARAASVADGTIYLYFKSKEDILLSVFVDSMDSIIEWQEKALEGMTDPVERLQTFISVHFKSVGQSSALAEVITVELRQSSKFMRNTDMSAFGRYLAMIARIIADGQEQGVFVRELNTRRVARMLFGALDELALEWAMDQRLTSLEEASAQTCTVFVQGLRPRTQTTNRGEP